ENWGKATSFGPHQCQGSRSRSQSYRREDSLREQPGYRLQMILPTPTQAFSEPPFPDNVGYSTYGTTRYQLWLSLYPLPLAGEVGEPGSPGEGRSTQHNLLPQPPRLAAQVI